MQGQISRRARTPFQLFLGSLALTLANPKTMIFFIALLPTVVQLDQLTLLGFAELVVAISILLPLTLGATWCSRPVRAACSRARRRCVQNQSWHGAAMACAAPSPWLPAESVVDSAVDEPAGATERRVVRERLRAGEIVLRRQRIGILVAEVVPRRTRA